MAQSEFSWPLINDNITRQDKDALIQFINTPSVRFTNGKKVKEFEKKWSEWLGVGNTTYVNSGASANYIMMSIVKELRGTGEIIVPPIGWVSDIAPVVNLGMTPVFVDVDKRNFSISDELIDFARKRDILLIEDCCESHGVTYNGKKVGTMGDMSNFSFYFGHHITTVEGGVVCTNSAEIHEYARLFRSHGMTRETSPQFREQYVREYPNLNPLFTFAVPGYNFRNTEMNAVIGLEQMERLDYNIERRSENLNTWLDNLNESKFFVDFDRQGNSNFALPLLLKDKSDLSAVCATLEGQKVEYRLGTAGGGNQAQQPYLVEGKYTYRLNEKLINADYIHECGLYVGNHTDLTSDQVQHLCRRLNEI